MAHAEFTTGACLALKRVALGNFRKCEATEGAKQLLGKPTDEMTCRRKLQDKGSKLDLKAPLVHRTDGDFPVAWTKTYGKGRVFYSTLGHPRELWDTKWMQTMYFEALKWSMER